MTEVQTSVEIFQDIKTLLVPYEKKGFVTRFDLDSKYDLRSEKEGIIVNDKPRKEVYFC
jgi:hypothetical protein